MRKFLLGVVLLFGLVGCQERYESYKGFHVVSEPDGYCVVLELYNTEAAYVVKNIKKPEDAQTLANRLNQTVEPYRPEDLRYRH